ncbi:MAG: GH116 family glycosyl hydrolase [Paludibacter sp.]
MIGIYNHYLYTGDAEFVKQVYPRMKSTLDFCLGRLNKDGIAEGLKSDWVFVDWAPIKKKGEISFEQLLFIQSLAAVEKCAVLTGDIETKEKLEKMYGEKLKQFDEIFWSEKQGAYIHNRLNGKTSDTITRYTNMFSVLFGLANDERKNLVKNNVLLNDSVLGITTPYMKFYELAALCEVGEQKRVLEYVKSYWGGMLKLGATSVWETFDPTLPDTAHYAMYGRPYGKSLCHAWGANPVFLFGRYFLGVYPTEPGYKAYIIEPNLGGLKWMEGTVPTPVGDIKVSVNSKKITIQTANSIGGVLKFTSKNTPKTSAGTIEKLNTEQYSLKLEKANSMYEIEIK